MYRYHYDHVTDQWNIFKVVGGREEYVRFFNELEDARSFCDINNGAAVSFGFGGE